MPSTQVVPLETAPATPLFVSRENDGEKLELRRDQPFTLELPEYYLWTVRIEDDGVLALVEGGEQAKGEGYRATFQARQVGETTLTATGDSPCLQKNPRCGAPLALFHLVVIVDE